jgi:hypothetical protein
MTRSAIIAELQSLDARRAQLEQQLADIDAGLIREPTGIERFPVLSKAPKSIKTRDERELEMVGNVPLAYLNQTDPDTIPATLTDESHAEVDG